MTFWALCVVIGKVALLTFLAVGVVTIIVVRRRRMRASWAQYLATEPSVRRQGGPPPQPGYEATIRGAMPHTPLPDWMYQADDEASSG